MWGQIFHLGTNLRTVCASLQNPFTGPHPTKTWKPSTVHFYRLLKIGYNGASPIIMCTSVHSQSRVLIKGGGGGGGGGKNNK